MKQSAPALALILFACLPPGPVFAGSQAEYMALQQWCVGRDKWTAEGRKTDYPNPDVYLHFQHYCSALNALEKIYSTIDANKQRYQAGLVVGETGYIISHAPESHPLMSEVYALRGRAQVLVKQTPQAESSLLKALQLDPRHLGAYASLGNLYLETNRKDRAVAMTQAGLAIDAQNKALRRLADKLAIKVEYLKPASAQPAPDTAKSAPDTKPAVEAAAAKAAESTGHAEAAIPKMGSPKNPWCRFCPNEPAAPAAPEPSTPATTPKAGR